MTIQTPVAAGFRAPQGTTRDSTPPDDEVVEVALLLPRSQAAAVEEAAHTRGLTAGQMLRKLIRNGLRDMELAN